MEQGKDIESKDQENYQQEQNYAEKEKAIDSENQKEEQKQYQEEQKQYQEEQKQYQEEQKEQVKELQKEEQKQQELDQHYEEEIEEKQEQYKEEQQQEQQQQQQNQEKKKQEQIEEEEEDLSDCNQIINIEVCIKCKEHSWCTRHDEQKYHQMYLATKKAIQALGINYGVVKNRGIAKPALGAFEVRLQNKLLFSKIKGQSWPFYNDLAAKINTINDLIKKNESWEQFTIQENQQELEEKMRQPRSMGGTFNQSSPNGTRPITHINNVPKYN